MQGSRLTSLFFPAMLVLALPAVAARPVIDSINPNGGMTAITINGSNLGGNPARTVFLSGYATPLAVTSSNNNQIVATLPAGLPAGGYAVRVQGTGNGDFDEFFVTFTASGGSGAACTSYANSASSGTFGPQLSVLQGGSYAISAKLAVNTLPGPTNVYCSLTQVGPFLLIDDTFVNATGSLNVVLQGTATVSGLAQFQATCTGGSPTGYYNWKIQAICLQSLVAPSP